ncbi:MAG: EAL domain-containing protein, partial [Huintestinicola sp.]
LSDKALFTYDYRVLRNGKTLYFRMKAVNVSKNEGLHHAVLGFADISYQKMQDIENYAYLSAVTGGDNYNRFKELLRERHASGFMAAMDLYAFKIVNSTCGIHKGDEALKATWQCITESMDDNDLGGHINADHFVIYFADSSRDVVIEKITKITKLLAAVSSDMEIPLLSPYFGIAEWSEEDSIEQVYGYAVTAKHTVKDNRDINYAFYSKEDSERILASKQMEDSFESAVANNEFELWYQPKYNPDDGELIGAEALVRWRRDGKLVPPGVFIPIFEKNGMIRKLDEYVFRTVCTQQKQWENEGKTIIPISVNISRVSLYFQNVGEQYKNIVDSIGIQTRYVPLEITESAAVANVDIKELTEKFFNAGFALHMDDFGTGYSSLSTLNQMHFNTLKLDKTMIDYIGNYGGDKLLEHIIALAKDLGLHVTAEGVESEAQVNFLKGLHCDSIQGYFYSKPIPSSEFSKFLSGKKHFYGEGSIDNKESLKLQSCNIKETLAEIIASVSDYAAKQGKNMVSNPFTLNETVYQDKEKFVSLMNNVMQFTIDHIPLSECVIFVCSRNAATEADYISYKFVIIGINACLNSTEVYRLLTDDKKLAASQEIVRELGGSLIAEAQEDKDVQITLRIPFKQVKDKNSSHLDMLEAAVGRHKNRVAAGKRILMVDDNELNRALTSEILDAAGFCVESVENGEEAYNAVMSHEGDYYSLVLMDIMMPVTDGYEATSKIRSSGKTLPIFALSSLDTQNDRQKAMECVMNAYIGKPLDVETLINEIKKTEKQ